MLTATDDLVEVLIESLLGFVQVICEDAWAEMGQYLLAISPLPPTEDSLETMISPI
jgi:hypothetical protein